jgi:hypothetical protein
MFDSEMFYVANFLTTTSFFELLVATNLLETLSLLLTSKNKD